MGDLVFNGIKVEELDLTNKIEGAVSLILAREHLLMLNIQGTIRSAQLH